MEDTSALVCFEASKLCLRRKTSPASIDEPLDLDVRREDMMWVLAELNIIEYEEEGAVRVRERPVRFYPDIPGGVASLYWAAKNPLQAWRIFLPTPTE